jgi:hypothetical protein
MSLAYMYKYISNINDHDKYKINNKCQHLILENNSPICKASISNTSKNNTQLSYGIIETKNVDPSEYKFIVDIKKVPTRFDYIIITSGNYDIIRVDLVIGNQTIVYGHPDTNNKVTLLECIDDAIPLNEIQFQDVQLVFWQKQKNDGIKFEFPQPVHHERKYYGGRHIWLFKRNQHIYGLSICLGSCNLIYACTYFSTIYFHDRELPTNELPATELVRWLNENTIECVSDEFIKYSYNGKLIEKSI